MKKIISVMSVMIILLMMISAMPAFASAADAVASIGSTTYTSLDEAIDAAQDGDTVLVLKDTTLGIVSVQGKKITVKAEGTTKPVITPAERTAGFYLDGADADLTIENVAFSGGWLNIILYGNKSGGTEARIYKITLNNVDVTFAASGALYGYGCRRSEVVVTNCTFTGGYARHSILNPSIAPYDATYTKFENVTLVGCGQNINTAAQGALKDISEAPAPAEPGTATSDADAIAQGAVARLGETATGKFGEVFFENLAEAIDVAEDGATIYILKDITGFTGATYAEKTLTFKGVNKYTISAGASFAFTINGGAGINLENLIFADYTGKNLIQFAKAGGGVYNINLKNVEVNFVASGAIYGYYCADAIITVENCVFNAGAVGNNILNFTNKDSYTACTLNVKDTVLNDACGVAHAMAQYATVNEEYSSDAAAIAAKIKVRLGATEGGKVGEVYFRKLDAKTIACIEEGTKITVLCTCGAKKEIAEIVCFTKVTCSACNTEIADFVGEHNYSEATCTKKPTCTVCGDETGHFAAHDYSVATCIQTEICTVCGAESGYYAPHDYSAATCIQTEICAVCGAESGYYAPHNYSIATCTKKATCIVCGVETGDFAYHRDYNFNGKCDACDAVLYGEVIDTVTQAVQADLNNAITELNTAITNGDTALDAKITALNTALTVAKTALESADAANKSELEGKINEAYNTLDAAVKAVQKNLDDAKAELNKAITDGDTALDGKITALNTALTTAKTALESADAANKSELEGKITEAYNTLDTAIKAVQANLDNLKTQLEAKDAALEAKDAELEAKNAALEAKLGEFEEMISAFEEKLGCSGTVSVAGVALVAALGTCAVFVEKKRK